MQLIPVFSGKQLFHSTAQLHKSWHVICSLTLPPAKSLNSLRFKKILQSILGTPWKIDPFSQTHWLLLSMGVQIATRRFTQRCYNKKPNAYGFREFCRSRAKVDGLFPLHGAKFWLSSLGEEVITVSCSQTQSDCSCSPARGDASADASYLTAPCCVCVLQVNRILFWDCKMCLIEGERERKWKE